MLRDIWRRRPQTTPSVESSKEPSEVERLLSENAGLRNELSDLRKRLWAPPGHFYSPIVDVDEILRQRAAVHGPPRPILGIDLHEREQLDLLTELARFYPEQPWHDSPTPGLRYYFDNDLFSYADAIVLYSMMRHLRPKRIIEVGSGYSSAVMLDTSDRFLDGGVECLFIEPNPARLLSLMTKDDIVRHEVIRSSVQDVAIETFSLLDRGDVLFIDSTHVSKTGSDVNHEMFEILPRLRHGVYVHFHDVFHFEYPESWTLEENRSWNELYLLRAFLMHNQEFRIVFFNHFIRKFHGDLLETLMPLCVKNAGGSLWLQKV